MSENAPTVSVVIPCYNLGAYVDEAVQSVLDQTFPDFEILLIDDGSTDPITQALFTSYQRPGTRVFRTENQGLAKTRNFGIAQSTGRFITFLDADDLLEPAFLERTVAVLEREPEVAFASCWLKAFGKSTFLRNPTTCDFPQLLVENTICSAALERKDALLAAGGFDPDMPVPGYEGWDLAIGMVERGLHGRIVPEYLFRYRIRSDSMSGSRTSPANHAALMRYIVEKHQDSYRKHLAGALETIASRTIEMEARPVEPTGVQRSDREHRAAALEGILRGVLESNNWRLTRPLRRVMSRLRSAGTFPSERASRPRISAVLTCLDDGLDLAAAFEGISLQMARSDEIVIVDAGSTDAISLQLLDGYRGAGVRVLRSPDRGRVRARQEGLRLARGGYVFALDAGQRLEEGSLARALQLLEGDPSLVFVPGGLRDASGFVWTAAAAELPAILACPRHAFPLVWRESLEQVGGYDGALPSLANADWDLAIRLAAKGLRGGVVGYPLVRLPTSPTDAPQELPSSASRIRPVFEKHRAVFERHWKAVVLGHEAWRRSLQAFACDPPAPQPTQPAAVDWGNLRRLQPVSRVWGVDRGQPIDRYYIERFLSSSREAIRGRVLEVKEPTYTNVFGTEVERSDIVDIAADNRRATIVADLSAADSLPADAFDCFILTQTIHIIYGLREVLRNAARSLKPGGTLLATLPCVSRLDYESGLNGDFWRFTPASARRLVEEAFPGGDVDVRTYGNVLACCGFLHGIAAGELTSEELDAHDPYFPLLVCVRAVKARTAADRMIPSSRAKNDARGASDGAAVLLYHRIDRASRDRWRLCVPPETFAAHMELLAKRFEPQPLSRLAELAAGGRIPSRTVAVTFDDGYRDNLEVAWPILKRLGIPATFFVSGDGAAEDGSFWWEVLNRSLEESALDEDAARELHWRLMHSSPEDRREILAGIPRPARPLPPRLTRAEVLELSREPLAEIGAHGWSHRALAGLPGDTLRDELDSNVRMLVDATGLPIVSFAYPFGGPETDETRRALGASGLRIGCVIGEKAVTSETGSLSLPRLDVRGGTPEELADRLERVLAP